MNISNYFIGHDQLLALSITDVIIVYLFCTLQVSYNILTGIYIKRANSKIDVKQLWRAYLFAFAPIVYSLLPILLVLFFYNPNPNNIQNNTHLPGESFALNLVWIHLPPIILVFTCIFAWNVVAYRFNRKIDSWNVLIKNKDNLKNHDSQIHDWDTNTKVIFRKVIYKWYLKFIENVQTAEKNADLNNLLKLSAKLEGWYIAKQRFQFFWMTKKSNKWIKQYYSTHYTSLRFHLLNAFNGIFKASN